MIDKLFLNKGYIDDAIGNQIWSNMIRKKRMLPTATFSEYLGSC